MNNMKHLLYTAAILLMAAACTNEEMEQATMTEGKAEMQFAVSTSECPVQITRATAVPEVETFTVHITGGTNVDITKTLEELQNERPLYLEAGENGTDYTVEAYSCDPDKGYNIIAGRNGCCKFGLFPAAVPSLFRTIGKFSECLSG